MFSTFTLPSDKIWYLILYLGTLYGNRLYVWLSHHFGQTKQKICDWTQLLKHVSVTHPYMYIREPGSWKCRNEILNTSEMIQKQLSNKGKPDSFVKWQRLILVLCMTGIANFIDEWSHWDFCFTSFGVMLENLESSITTKKKPFSDFPARAPGMYNYRDGYTE